MSNIEVPKGFKPRDYQLEFLGAMDAGCNRALLVWPRQVGKDTTCSAFIFKKAAETPGNYFYVFPTKEMARKAVWEKILDDGSKLLDMLPPELKTRLNNQEMLIELYNGSTIRLVGLDTNPDAIRGITPQGIIFSEFAFSDPEAYKAVLPALRRKGSWMVINSTPNGRNHFYQMYIGTQGNKDWFVSYKQALRPGKENYLHIHNAEHFEELAKQGVMTWDDIEREYGCSFSSGLKGSYYIDYLEKAYGENRVGAYPHNPNLIVDTFWDMGASDDTVIWFRQKDGDRLLFIDYVELSRTGFDDIVWTLKEKGYRYGTHYVPHDAGHSKQGRTIETAADQLMDALMDMKVSGDVEVVDKPLSKQPGINAVRKRFHRYHFNKEKCHLGIEKLELYHRKWDKKHKVFTKDPVHDGNSHCADALRLEAEVGEDTLNPFWEQEIVVKTDYDLFD